MKTLIHTLLLACSLFSLPALAEDAAPPAEKYISGKHYKELAVPVRTNNQEKIEVNEVFWYGCPHCFHFEDAIEPWRKTLPDDVDFQRTPAVWRAQMEPHARAYYTAKQLNMLDSMHTVIFKAMQEEKNPLASENEIAALFAAHGVDDATFRKAYNSFSVQSLSKQADARVRSYGVTGTPEIIVDGKYRISSRDAGSQEEMLSIANFLIEKERAARASARK